MSRYAISRYIVIAIILMMSGCLWVHEPSEWEGEYEIYCDEYGCHYCSSEGCGQAQHDCLSSQCEPSRCRKDQDCALGMQCDSDGICRKTKSCPYTAIDGGCGTPNHLDAGIDCENCVTTDAQVKLCSSEKECPSGQCINGICALPSDSSDQIKPCQFDRQCGKERTCLDGKCTSFCEGNEDCGSGQTCSIGICIFDSENTCSVIADCDEGEACLNNHCYPQCNAGGSCDLSKDICTYYTLPGNDKIGICHPDTQRKNECTKTSECPADQECVDNMCQIPCESIADCPSCSELICGNIGYCVTAIENNPQCSTNLQCSDGLQCLNARCTLLGE